MKTNNYVISLLAAMMIVSQSPVVINANNITNYQYDSIGNIVKQNESLQADIFNVDFSVGQMTYHPLQNELGKTIGNPKIIESDELHKILLNLMVAVLIFILSIKKISKN